MLAESLPQEVLRAVQQAAASRSSPRRCGCSCEYDWPGNVRELENLIKRVVVLGTEAPIRSELSQRDRAARGVAHGPARPARCGRRRDGRRAGGRAAGRRRPIAPGPATACRPAAGRAR